jgi:hypothetical protein
MEATAYEGAGFAHDLAVVIAICFVAAWIIWLARRFSRKT